MSLAGWTIPVKDNIDVAGVPTRAGSRATSTVPAARDAEIVRRLRTAGATIGEKTSLDEFACTTLGPGLVNPRDPARSTGGSSGGSASAVALGTCRVALGTDTGGSIRIPASYCGVVGFKPTLHELPTRGVVPLSTTLDHVGLVGDRVASVAHVFGHCRTRTPAGPKEPLQLRVGIPEASYLSAAQPDVLAAWSETIGLLADHGAVVSTVTMPDPEQLLAFHFDISAKEAARFHLTHFPDLSRHGDCISSLIQMGRRLDENAYRSALEKRAGATAQIDQCFRNIDLLVTPTTPTTAPLVDSTDVRLGNGRTVGRLEASIWYTALFNEVGAPAISLPIDRPPHMPIGIQLAAARGNDDLLLGCAQSLEALLTHNENQEQHDEHS